MTSIRMFVVAFGLALAGCAGPESDSARFESWASALATVPVSDDAPILPRQSAEDAGLRGPVDDAARQGLRVELVDPDLLWEARAVGVEEAVRGRVEPAVREVASEAAREAVREVVADAPAVVRETVRGSTGVTVQLGAFSSLEAARSAWSRLEAHGGLAAAQPVYETVERDGRSLVRLRAGPVATEVVGEVCRAAGAGDFCASTARS